MLEAEKPVFDPTFEKMISKWKRISKDKVQESLCHKDRKLKNKKRRKETLNNGKVF